MQVRRFESVRSVVLSDAARKEGKLVELGLVISLSSFIIYQLISQLIGLF